jgi:hypothetical protein
LIVPPVSSGCGEEITSHSVLGHIRLRHHPFYGRTELAWARAGHGMTVIN